MLVADRPLLAAMTARDPADRPPTAEVARHLGARGAPQPVERPRTATSELLPTAALGAVGSAG